MTRLVIGDDHRLFLDVAATVLADRGFAVTVAASVAETVAAVARTQPDVCLLDRHFAGEDSVGAVGEVTAASPGTRVLVLSADPDRAGVLAALRAGASGYVHKTRGVSALTAAINRVLRGEVVVDVPGSAPPGAAARRADGRPPQLTTRERECLELLVDGMDTTAMARALGVSRATVRTHVQSVLTKLEVHSRLEAASYATRHRLLEGKLGGVPGNGAGPPSWRAVG